MTCGLVAAVGCGGQSDDGDTPSDDTAVGTYALEDSEHTRNVRVFDNVKRLEDRAAREVYIDADMLVFPAAVSDALAKYEAGDIMATSAGQGLLRRVERIEHTDAEILVHTSSASLAEVFASGEIYVAAHAEPDLQTPESFRYRMQDHQIGQDDFQLRRQGLEVDWEKSLFSWNRDFASELNTRISAALGASDRLIIEEASLSAELGGEFYADAGASVFPPSFELRTLRAGANGTANATLRLRIQSDDAFSFNRTFYLASTDPSHNALKTLPAQSADVAGLVQLTFNADSKLDLSASVDGTVTATGEVQVNGNLSGGLERKNGVWQTYTTSGVSPSGYAPEFGGEKNFSARAVLETTLTVEISDTVNGSLVVKPATVTADFRQDINAGSGECPYYFNVNVRGDVSGQLESISVVGFDVNIMDSPSSWTMYDKDLLTEQGQIGLPGICDPNYEPPSFGDGGQSLEMACKEKSDCKSGLACFRDTCVTEGPIRFSVAWFEDTDVDLQVTTPSGDVLDWRGFANGAVGGLFYDFPKCTGTCRGPGPYVENIYSEISPQPGTYIIEVVHEDARAQSDFALLIDHDGDITHDGGTLGAEGESVRFEYTVN
jgi:hypothetical protein